MPFSISTVRWVGVPSSSTLSEPRRAGMVPSSTTVHSSDATRWPMRSVKARRLLAVEVAFEAMADRFVQQNARPARTEHDIHRAGRARRGGQSSTSPGAPPRWRSAAILLVDKETELDPSAAAKTADLPVAVLLDDAGDIEPGQRLDIADDQPLG